jgi:hypothetical protein
MKAIFVQSVLPQEDVIALKEKSGESSIKEAITRAVYHYLKCEKVLETEEVSNINVLADTSHSRNAIVKRI